MSNEPVAWMRSDWSRVSLYEGDLCTIPLYTHPAKEHFEDEPQAEELHEIMHSNAELTDEEIDNLENLFTKLNERWGDDLWIDASHLVDLASAIVILRKAQEK